MRWVVVGLTGLLVLQLGWGAFARIGSPLYWSVGIAVFVAIWTLWLWFFVRRLKLAGDGDPGIGYCITLILVTVAEAVGLIAAYHGDDPTVEVVILFLLINSLGAIGLGWMGWAKRRSKGEGFLFNASTVEFARGALPLAMFIPCICVALGLAHSLPLGSADAPSFVLATTYLTKSANLDHQNRVVGVGTAKEGIQVLLNVSPQQFSGEWPSLLVIDVHFDDEFQSEWRISGASHAFVGSQAPLVDMLVKESNERQSQADVQWMTHFGFLVPDLAVHMVGLNTEATREDLRLLPPIEVISPEEPSGVETLLLREIPPGPLVVQLVLERRNQDASDLDVGKSLHMVTQGAALEYAYR